MMQMAQGNLEDVLAVGEDQTEIGQLAFAVNDTKERTNRIIKDIGFVMHELADGNFIVKSKHEESYIGSYQPILISMETLKEKQRGTLSQIGMAADQVSSGSEQVSSGAQSLAQGATEQASAIQELSASMNEVSAHSEKTAKNAEEAKAIAVESTNVIYRGKEQMNLMVKSMEEISNTSNEIGKIIKAIEDIAFQTNILALNAAVEAARAGEAGKGFAVVADEVRNLAGKSAESAKNTAALIEKSVYAVEQGVNIVNETAKSLDDVVMSADKSARIIQFIADASEEQATSIEQVNIGVEQIAAVVQTNSATAEESAAASEELSGQSMMLKELIGHFKLKGNQDVSLNSMETSNHGYSDMNYSNYDGKY